MASGAPTFYELYRRSRYYMVVSANATQQFCACAIPK